MMKWLDFEFDEVLGPVLSFSHHKISEQWSDSQSVMDDAKHRAQGCARLQEIEPNQRPARMVGLDRGSDFQCVEPGTEASLLEFSTVNREGEG